MKKILLIILTIIFIFALFFGVKKLLDMYSEEANSFETTSDYLEDGWEIEAEYTYNGTISENELQYLEDDNAVVTE